MDFRCYVDGGGGPVGDGADCAGGVEDKAMRGLEFADIELTRTNKPALFADGDNEFDGRV